VAPNPPLCRALPRLPCEPIIGWRTGKSWRKFGRFVLTNTRVSHVLFFGFHNREKTGVSRGHAHDKLGTAAFSSVRQRSLFVGNLCLLKMTRKQCTLGKILALKGLEIVL